MVSETAIRPARSAGRVPVFAGLLLLAACTAGFVALAMARGWVNDDALITSRYAVHIAGGHGYVWNIVEPQRVEGSTSIAWTLLQAAAVRLRADPVWFAHLLGLASGALVLVAVYLGAWHTLGLGPVWALAGVAFLAAQRQFVLWSVSGMETSAAAFIVLAATLQLLREAAADDAGQHRALGRGLASGLLFFLGSLLRPETPLLHLAAGIGIVATHRRRGVLRLVLASGLVHAAGLVLLTGWRIAYFGQPLPNPFYVKVGAIQFGRGLRFLGAFLVQNQAWLWGGAILVAAPLLWRRARLPFVTFAASILAWSVWLVALGGDVWEFRMLVPILPFCALLFALGVAHIAAPGSRWLRLRQAVAALLVLAVGISQLGVLRSGFRKFGDSFSVEELAQSSSYMSLEASLLAPYLGPNDRLCTGWSGAIPYFTGAWHFDPWGLNDPAIARRPLETGTVLYHQRHATWDDVVANRVLVCDLFNHFLFPQPFDASVSRRVAPWVEPGVPVYTVRLPAGQYWIFTSSRPRAEVDSWLGVRGLSVESVVPLPAGWPRLGG